MLVPMGSGNHPAYLSEKDQNFITVMKNHGRSTRITGDKAYEKNSYFTGVYNDESCLPVCFVWSIFADRIVIDLRI